MVSKTIYIFFDSCASPTHKRSPEKKRQAKETTRQFIGFLVLFSSSGARCCVFCASLVFVIFFSCFPVCAVCRYYIGIGVVEMYA